jgi:hypothetical protein
MPKAKQSREEADAELSTSIEELIETDKSEEPATPAAEPETSGAKPDSEKEEVVADTDKPETLKEDGGETPSTKVKIGDVEYTPDELKVLVEKGKFTKEIEDKQKIDISQLYPEFTRRSQLLSNPEGLRNYIKAQFGYDVNKIEQPISEEEKALKEQVKRARDVGFLTKDDVQDIVGNVMQSIELRDLKRSIEDASAKHKVEPAKLVDYMAYKNTKDAETAAQEMENFNLVASGKAPVKPTTTVPQKPEVLKTETKGTGVRQPPKERPIPHPDREPEAYAARILEFLEPKSPEEV